MRRMIWRSITTAKFFYVRTYRRVCTLIIISLMMSVFLIVLIIHFYLNRPEPDYYATNGVTAPVLLNALDTANKLTSPLLPPDQIISNQTKVIPN